VRGQGHHYGGDDREELDPQGSAERWRAVPADSTARPGRARRLVCCRVVRKRLILTKLGALTERVVAPTPVARHARVRQIVDAAQQRATTVTLTGDSRPTHLPAWLGSL
jgi:hypothetical protein